MFDHTMQEALHKATTMTRKNKNEFITLEHFLLCSLDSESVQKFFNDSAHIDVNELKTELKTFIKDNHKPIPRLSSQYNPEPTIGLHRSIERALKQAQAAGKNQISSLHVVLALFEEQESYALYLLEKNGLTPLIIMEHLSSQPDALGGPSAAKSKDPLKIFCEDLNKKFKKGEVNPLIGREDELNRVVEVLSRKTKNNPLLVGDPGVGKTAIGQGLAEKSVEDKLPGDFKNLKVFELDLAALLAGSKYRGDFEARMKSLLSELKKVENPLLLIDEIHTIVGAGTTSGSQVDFASLLKPSLSDPHLKVMGTTTYEEYRKHFAKDPALSRRFQAVFVEEPSSKECLKILRESKKNYESFHKVSIEDEALKECVDLSKKHLLDKKFPDKAFDLLDETCAHERTIKQNFTITAANVKTNLKQLYKISTDQVDKESSDIVLDLKEKLKADIYGQDKAIDELHSSILVAYSGLKIKDKPLGSFLFTGPTGVGKTELTKRLAENLNLPLIRFDMSEYMEKHSVSRLIGSPPGYVGHEEGGRLTDEVSKSPHSILLLDEIEKAHPDVINILLQVMDSGVLTDSIGKKTYFNNCILIMTSNSGAREADRGSMGIFEAPSSDFSDKAIKNFFTPEFINRLTSIVKFKSLDRPLLLKVVQKELKSLSDEVKILGHTLEWTKEIEEWVLEKAHEKGMGARPFERFISKNIRTPIAEKLLKLKKPGSKDSSELSTLKLTLDKEGLKVK